MSLLPACPHIKKDRLIQSLGACTKNFLMKFKNKTDNVGEILINKPALNIKAERKSVRLRYVIKSNKTKLGSYAGRRYCQKVLQN